MNIRLLDIAKIAFVLFSAALGHPVSAGKVDPNHLLMLWTGIEIVTDDNEVRNLTKRAITVPVGNWILISDPIFKKNCDRIRTMPPSHKVGCRSVVSQGNSSLFVVEIKSKKPKVRKSTAPVCRLDFELTSYLREVARSHSESARFNLVGTAVGGEFINENGILDSMNPAAHALATKTSDDLRGEFADLKRGSNSCRPSDRADSIHLMNYSGLPEHSLEAAMDKLHDSDGGVRNNAARLVGSFIQFAATKSRKYILEVSCAKILEEDFLEINKGLAMMLSSLKGDHDQAKFLSAACQSKVKLLAVESNSPQIGSFARFIEAILVRPGSAPN